MNKTYNQRVREQVAFINSMNVADAELATALSKNLERALTGSTAARIACDAIVEVLARRQEARDRAAKKITPAA